LAPAQRLVPGAARKADSANGVGDAPEERVNLFLASRHATETMVAGPGCSD